MSSAKFVQKFKDMWNPPEDEFDDYDYDEQVEDVYEDEEPDEEYQEPARHSHARAQETNSMHNLKFKWFYLSRIILVKTPEQLQMNY